MVQAQHPFQPAFCVPRAWLITIAAGLIVTIVAKKAFELRELSATEVSALSTKFSKQPDVIRLNLQASYGISPQALSVIPDSRIEPFYQALTKNRELQCSRFVEQLIEAEGSQVICWGSEQWKGIIDTITCDCDHPLRMAAKSLFERPLSPQQSQVLDSRWHALVLVELGTDSQKVVIPNRPAQQFWGSITQMPPISDMLNGTFRPDYHSLVLHQARRVASLEIDVEMLATRLSAPEIELFTKLTQ